MSENLKGSRGEIDKDLDRSWMELSDHVRELAKSLQSNAAGSDLAVEAKHLAEETSLLCDHVERLHKDVKDLLRSLDAPQPLPEDDLSSEGRPRDVDHDDVQRESIQIQREQHRKSNLKEVIKALFLYVDDPVERVRGKR